MVARQRNLIVPTLLPIMRKEKLLPNLSNRVRADVWKLGMLMRDATTPAYYMGHDTIIRKVR